MSWGITEYILCTERGPGSTWNKLSRVRPPLHICLKVSGRDQGGSGLGSHINGNEFGCVTEGIFQGAGGYESCEFQVLPKTCKFYLFPRKLKYFYFVCMSVFPTCIHVLCMPGAQGGQKSALYPLELEL